MSVQKLWMTSRSIMITKNKELIKVRMKLEDTKNEERVKDSTGIHYGKTVLFDHDKFTF